MNNNKKKQIDDIAKYICKNYSPYCSMCPDCYAQEEATAIYNAGYRKQAKEDLKIEKRLIPTKLSFSLHFKNTIAGYCPSCNGTVVIKNTFVRKVKGACCSWCGQRILFNFKE